MAAEFLKEHQFIVDTMSACTHDVSIIVEYQFIRPRLVGLDIFPRMTLSRDEGRGRASCDIMINICESAKRLSKDDFIKFVDAIGEDYVDAAEIIRRKYRQVSGKDLPTNTVEEHVPVMCTYDVSNRGSPRRSTQPVPNPRVVPPLATIPVEIPVYRMNTDPRGLALIINNVNFDTFSLRQGSDKDVENLTAMFQKLKFKIYIKKNLTAKVMKRACKSLANNNELRNVSALSVVILTHGTVNDCYFGKDGEVDEDGKPLNYITKTKLAKIFNSRNCKHMIKKPKLFIIQACRGEEENPHVESGSERQEGNDLNNDAPRSDSRLDTSEHHLDSDSPRADTADMCFLHSSSIGYKAYRGPDCGSPFVEVFTNLILNSSHTDEFHDIVQKMQWLFSEKKLSNEMMTLPDFSTQLMKWYIIPHPH